MTRRRKSDGDPDPDDFRLGGADVGSIVQLSDKDPPGKPFPHTKADFPMGFDIRPGVHKKRAKRWRNVRAFR